MNKKLNIALIGYGKMGREIEKLAPGLHMHVAAIADNEQQWQELETLAGGIDVAIEFTTPQAVTGNLKRLMDMGLPVVTGTTGWMDQLPEIQNYCQKSNGSLFYASNFSIGVNIFFALNKYLANIMSQYPDYRIDITEAHHKQKLDAPSGTAISLLDDIMQEASQYTGWSLQQGQVADDKIPVTAIREEGVTGTHTVNYTSAIDTITITHAAHNRKGFASGALMAARWLTGKKGVFTMNDLLKL